jgi:hypothetical protein
MEMLHAKYMNVMQVRKIEETRNSGNMRIRLPIPQAPHFAGVLGVQFCQDHF